MKKVIIQGSKVRRVSAQPNGFRRVLTVRNLIGFAGIMAFVVAMIRMIVGGG